METTFSSHNNCSPLRLSAIHCDSLRLLAIIRKPGLKSIQISEFQDAAFLVNCIGRINIIRKKYLGDFVGDFEHVFMVLGGGRFLDIIPHNSRAE